MKTQDRLEALMSVPNEVYDVRPRPRARRQPASDGRTAAQAPSGDLFGWSQDVGMGWKPVEWDDRNS